jgi:branched-subunit amino acid transport protein AzlD
MLWAGIGVSISFGSELWWVRLMLVAIATCTTLYLVLVLKTVEP